jgi:hypothetical protein
MRWKEGDIRREVGKRRWKEREGKTGVEDGW